MVCWEILKFHKSDILNILEKVGAGTSEDSLNECWNFLNTGTISSRKHELKKFENLEYEIDIWKNLVILVLNMESKSSRKHEMQVR